MEVLIGSFLHSLVYSLMHADQILALCCVRVCLRWALWVRFAYIALQSASRVYISNHAKTSRRSHECLISMLSLADHEVAELVAAEQDLIVATNYMNVIVPYIVFAIRLQTPVSKETFCFRHVKILKGALSLRDEWRNRASVRNDPWTSIKVSEHEVHYKILRLTLSGVYQLRSSKSYTT